MNPGYTLPVLKVRSSKEQNQKCHLRSPPRHPRCPPGLCHACLLYVFVMVPSACPLLRSPHTPAHLGGLPGTGGATLLPVLRPQVGDGAGTRLRSGQREQVPEGPALCLQVLSSEASASSETPWVPSRKCRGQGSGSGRPWPPPQLRRTSRGQGLHWIQTQVTRGMWVLAPRARTAPSVPRGPRVRARVLTAYPEPLPFLRPCFSPRSEWPGKDPRGPQEGRLPGLPPPPAWTLGGRASSRVEASPPHTFQLRKPPVGRAVPNGHVACVASQSQAGCRSLLNPLPGNLEQCVNCTAVPAALVLE